MKKYLILKIENNKIVYEAAIIEAIDANEAKQKYVDKIVSYWGYCVYGIDNFTAKEL